MTNIILPSELVEQALNVLQKTYLSSYSSEMKRRDIVIELQSALSQSATDCRQLKPLTDEELSKILGFAAYTSESLRTILIQVARAIEASHGIGVTNE